MTFTTLRSSSRAGLSCGLLMRIATVVVAALLSACGGSANAPPPPETGTADVPPTITQQPADLAVTAGQPASFTVAATGTGSLSYQWQRNGVAISGATSTTYAIAQTVIGDTDAQFRAVVSNVAGSATSNSATLTVNASAPVLTITPQPADTSVTAGTMATFTVGGTCSSGTLQVQWQRSADAGATWTNIATATATTYSLSTVIGDSGARFRALLDCSGQSGAASSAATLTVTAPGALTLSLVNLVGLRAQADVTTLAGISRDAGGSFTFITASRIKRLSADLGTIDFVAGGPFAGSADGVGAAAAFNQPFGLTQDGAGNLYVADTGNHTIRRIAADGTVTTVAGLAGSAGASDGTGSAARFARPSGIAMGPDGDLYVSELDNNLIRRVTVGGVVTTYAGSTAGYLDGTALAAKFQFPRDLAVAANGDVLVADTSNNRIRRILRVGNAAGAVQTLAGDGAAVFGGSADGTGTAASIAAPVGVVVSGNVLTVRQTFGLLRQIDLTTAAVTTLTGSRTLGDGFADGPATVARIRDGAGVTTAPAGGFMLADDIGLRLVDAAGAVTTIASHSAAGVTPAGVGTLAQMPFSLAVGGFNRQGVAVDPAGNIIVSDGSARTVRRIASSGAVTLASGLVGAINAPLDGIGSAAQWVGPGAVASAASNVLYVIDDFAVRRIGTDNATTILAGSPTAFGAVDGASTVARFNSLFGIAVGSGGDVFVTANQAVRRIDSLGNVSTYAGVMGSVVGRVDGPIASARFQSPGAMVLAPDGALLLTDGGVIRRIAPDGSSVSTLTGGFGANNIAVDASGTIYFDDSTGLYSMPAGGGTVTLLIPTGPAVVLGSVAPRLSNINGLAVPGSKQVVILSGGQILLATLP